MENPVSADASRQVSEGSTGVDQDRGMCEEKRKMNRFPKFGTLNSGDPESVPAEAERRPRANGDQPQEDTIWTFRESDLPIVVRDGNTGHTASHRYAGASTAKERAGRQRKQSTHFQDTITPGKSVKLPTCIGNPLRPECRGWFHLRVFLRSPVR